RISERAGALQADPTEWPGQLTPADDLAGHLPADEIANERQISACDRVVDLRTAGAVELDATRGLEIDRGTDAVEAIDRQRTVVQPPGKLGGHELNVSHARGPEQHLRGNLVVSKLR